MKHDRAQCPCKNLPIRLSSFTSAEFGDVHSLSRLGENVVDQVDAGGYTPLHLAAQNNHASAIAYLLSIGADVDGRIRTNSTSSSQNLCGATPLHRAAYSGGLAAMRILLEWTCPGTGRRCDVLAEDTSFGDGMTPLHKATSGGRFLGVQLLLDSLQKRSLLGDGLASLDAQGRTPLELAREMVLKEDGERSSVRRWDAIAGGTADWERCAKILEVVSEKVVIQLVGNPLPLSGNNAVAKASEDKRVRDAADTDATAAENKRGTEAEMRRLTAVKEAEDACLDCGEAERCKTASWEEAFRSALSSSIAGLTSSAETVESREKSPVNDFSFKGSRKETGDSTRQLKGDSCSSVQPAASALTMGSNCSQCGVNCLSLFRDTDGSLVCKRCKRRPKKSL